jgi:hypothetical protein
MVPFCRFDINSQLKLQNLRVRSISGVASLARVSVHLFADAPAKSGGNGNGNSNSNTTNSSNNATGKSSSSSLAMASSNASMTKSRGLASSGVHSLSSSASSIYDGMDCVID